MAGSEASRINRRSRRRSAIRTFVMGADATQRAATHDEVEAMRRLVVEAVRAGIQDVLFVTIVQGGAMLFAAARAQLG